MARVMLAEGRPDLRKKFSPRNKKSFDDYTLKSKKSVLWICDKDPSHEYSVRIAHMVENNTGCSICSSQKNLLKNVRPDLKSQYSSKNSIPFEEIKAGSHKQVIWCCDKGHEWKAPVGRRVNTKQVLCKFCEKEKNLLVNLFPNVSQCYSKDNTIPVEEIAAQSMQKCKWVCPRGHYSTSTPREKTRYGDSFVCQQCKQEDYGLPERLKKFYSPNNKRAFETLTVGSERKMEWVCPQGHMWKQKVAQRVTSPVDCPVCDKESKLVKNIHPELRVEYSAENSRSFDELNIQSHYKATWECANGHLWKSVVRDRFQSNTGIPSMCPKCKKEKNLVSSLYPEFRNHYTDNNVIPFEELTTGMHHIIESVCKNGHVRKATVYNTFKYPNCRKCTKWGSSYGEQEIFDYVCSILPVGTIVKENDRTILSPKELDIYIPDKKIAIEFNGLYWHSEQSGKTRNYHKEKWELCKQKGIQLITIWEDDWRYKKDVIKSMLAHKLGVSNSPRVFARKTIVKPVDSTTARDFCDLYHIQGACGGTYYLGLYTKGVNRQTDELVAISVWRKNKNDIYLDRYCTSQTVVGGFSKLLAHAKALFTQEGFDHIITFADREVSDGSLYERTGFKVDSYLRPDYRYVREGKRYHKFGFRLKRFKNDPELLYRKGLTEGQLAELNELVRVWDCGKIKYVLPLVV